MCVFCHLHPLNKVCRAMEHVGLYLGPATQFAESSVNRTHALLTCHDAFCLLLMSCALGCGNTCCVSLDPHSYSILTFSMPVLRLLLGKEDGSSHWVMELKTKDLFWGGGLEMRGGTVCELTPHPSTCSIAPQTSSSMNHKFKDKSIKNLKLGAVEH